MLSFVDVLKPQVSVVMNVNLKAWTVPLHSRSRPCFWFTFERQWMIMCLRVPGATQRTCSDYWFLYWIFLSDSLCLHGPHFTCWMWPEIWKTHLELIYASQHLSTRTWGYRMILNILSIIQPNLELCNSENNKTIGNPRPCNALTTSIKLVPFDSSVLLSDACARGDRLHRNVS